jgi:hypothetical protein
VSKPDEREPLDDTERLKALYEACRRAYDEDYGRVDGLDRKASATLTLAGLLLGAGVLRVNLMPEALAHVSPCAAGAWIVIVLATAGLLAASVLCCVNVLMVREFGGQPDPKTILTEFQNESLETLYRSLAQQLNATHVANATPIRRKEIALTWALRCARLAVVGSVVVLVLALIWPALLSLLMRMR